LITDNKDILFTTDEDRRRFAKQIDITHMLYAGDTGDYLQNKRENARLLGEKGLSEKHRLYEIRGVSHFISMRDKFHGPIWSARPSISAEFSTRSSIAWTNGWKRIKRRHQVRWMR